MRLFQGGFLAKIKWLFDNGGTLGDAVEVYREWAAIEDPWDTTAGFRAYGMVAVKGARLVTDQTDTTADDAVVAQIEAFLNNDALVALTVGVIVQFKGQADEVLVQALTDGEAGQRLSEAVTAQGLNWPVILEAIKAIMALIAMFTSKSPAPVAGEGAPKPGAFDFLQS